MAQIEPLQSNLTVDGRSSPSNALNPVQPVQVIPNDPACGNCNAFWSDNTCRAHPPQPSWPLVTSVDWCREWQSVSKTQP